MSKNIIITAGGTVEPIDSVRGITNFSSGKFAKIIAEKLLNKGHNVTYVCERSCRNIPMTDTDYVEGAGDLNVINSTGVDGLISTLKELVPSHHMIIHMMAVSDYKVNSVREIKEKNGMWDLYEIENDGKVSSDLDKIYLELVKTPKVISKIKEWNPVIDLVGFKLLDNASIRQMEDAVTKSFKNNDCDYIVFNDLTEIRRGFHPVTIYKEELNLVADNHDESTKEESADLIIDTILN